MKRTVKVKNLIAFAAVLILLFSITAVPAYAVFGKLTPAGRRLGSLLCAAIQAINITLTSTAAQSPGADLYNYLADPFDVQYSYYEMWQDKPSIQIWPDYVTIDGVNYTDIWLSNEAAEKFRVDAYDFKTAYSIASNTNGTFASGWGYYDGVPLYDFNTYKRTQYYNIPYNTSTQDIKSYEFGSGTISNRKATTSGTNQLFEYKNSLNNSYTLSAAQKTDYDCYINVGQSGNPGFNLTNNGTVLDSTYVNSNLLNRSAFDFDYVSGNIPANEVLPSDTGMMIRVPSNTDGLQTFITNNYEFTNNGGIELDFQLDPTLEVKLDSLLDIIAPIIPLVNTGDIVFAPNHVEPGPVQDTLLPDTWWSTLENKLDNIIQAINNTIFNPAPIIQAIQNIPQSFSQITQPIVQAINDLGDTILKDIEEGPIKLLDKLIDVLRSIFFPILATLKSFLSIWHYVVEWIGNISAPFTWIIGIMQGTSSIMMSPIYALIAGAIVIAVYRRFGR